MTRKEARQKILDILEAQFGIDKAAISGKASFREDLDATSIDMEETVIAIEEEFGISFLWKEEEAIETISDAIDLIMSKIN